LPYWTGSASSSSGATGWRPVVHRGIGGGVVRTQRGLPSASGPPAYGP
jgi:hypothetical protein